MAAERPTRVGERSESSANGPASGFGEVLFGELKQIAIRRGGLAGLAAARESEVARRCPRAAEAVRDLIAIVRSQAAAIGLAGDSADRVEMDSEIREAEACLAEATAAGEEAPRNGSPARRFGQVVDHLLQAYQHASNADAVVEKATDRLRGAQGDRERLEADESVADRARSAALDRDLVGLAFSGGGIRSATFNLGILQGLAAHGLLGTFDYLSTVSGGGYIGAWLAAWIHREGDIDNVQKQLQPTRTAQAGASRRWPDPDPGKSNGKARPVRGVVEEEPEPIYHLRRYSNYLAPTTGLLSVDTWSMLSTYARNLLLNQLILLPAAIVLILVPRLVLRLFGADFLQEQQLALGLAMFVLGAMSFLSMYQFLLAPRRARSGLGWLVLRVILPLFGAAFLFALLFSRPVSPDLDIPGIRQLYASDRGNRADGSIPSALAFGLFIGGLRLAWFLVAGTYLLRRRGHRAIRRVEFLWRALSSFLTASTSATCLYAAMSWLRALMLGAPEWLAPTMAAFGLPVVILAVLLSTAIESGLLGVVEEEEVREWRASLGAYLMLGGLLWMMIFGISLYGPLVIAAAGRTLSAAMGLGWLFASSSGALAGRSARTRGDRAGTLEFLARVAPPIFVVGLLVLISILTGLLLGVVPPLRLDRSGTSDYWTAMDGVPWSSIGFASLGAAAVAIGISARLNVNLFSLHAFYANRLVRCYLGASRPEGCRPTGQPHYAPSNSPPPARRPNPITGFDRDDDFPLKELKAFARGGGAPGRGISRHGYPGPFPLINTALNLVSGKELAWQERRAESFVLTPLYSGSKTTGYRAMDASGLEGEAGERPFGFGRDLRLGTAMSISGAAASPNMGYHSSPAVTFLMTVFNARLGWWLGNPAQDDWRGDGPRSGFYLFNELLSRTDATSRHVYLSDGGHFENLGVYELIRRRCRYIVACDAGEDPALAFWDMGGLVRKCREDMGVRIEIDIAPILRESSGKSRWHCSIGRIRYDDIDAGAIPGVLLYIKPSLTGDEPTDIRNYVVDHPDFPHQSTVNQFFTESQFESYRALGEHIALEVFRDAARVGAASAGALFAALRRRWFPPPPDFDANFLKSVDAYIAIQGQLRTDPNLGRLSAELYPELSTAAGGYDVRARAEVHAIGQVLQVMENVWLTVGLEDFAEHPMNRGWMNWFRRWSGTAAFQRHWPALRGEFSQDFIRFAEKQLNLRVEPPGLIAFPGDGDDASAFHAAIGRLDAEFTAEWPTRPWAGPAGGRGGILEFLERTVARAGDLGRDGFVPAWLIREPALPDGSAVRPPWNGRACGVILAWADREEDRDAVVLFVWLRGPYRTLGIAGDCVETAIDAIRRRATGDGRFTLRVDYPMHDASGSKDRWQSMVWLRFFQRLGFRKERPETPDQEVLSLYREELVNGRRTEASQASEARAIERNGRASHACGASR